MSNTTTQRVSLREQLNVENPNNLPSSTELIKKTKIGDSAGLTLVEMQDRAFVAYGQFKLTEDMHPNDAEELANHPILGLVEKMIYAIIQYVEMSNKQTDEERYNEDHANEVNGN